MRRFALSLLCAGALLAPGFALAATAPATAPSAPAAATGKSAAVKKNPHRVASAKKTTPRHKRHAAATTPAPAAPTK